MDRKGKEERRAEKSVERGPGGMGLGRVGGCLPQQKNGQTMSDRSSTAENFPDFVLFALKNYNYVIFFTYFIIIM